MSATFVDELAAVTGVASIIAPHVVRRACARSGVDPSTLTPRNLSRVLEALESAMSVYLPTEEVAARMATIRKLAA